SAALLEQGALGRTHQEAADALVVLSRWLAGEQDDAGEWPGLVALEPARSRRGRHGAILLPFRALLAAIEAAR
ncbi:MAG TPA: iron-sulfur cluster assembly scaffold protein, partial [Sphingomicrobium sp.]|nr:iron-sulfur cluster assembly scaffold protein [Sphingomicrobium sp.]